MQISPKHSFAAMNQYASQGEDHLVFGFKFSRWKQLFLREMFPHLTFEFAPLRISEKEFNRKWAPRILKSENPTIYVWGMAEPKAIDAFAEKYNVRRIHFEDGFIRSSLPHASSELPISLIMDDRAMHFDYTKPSRLEEIFAGYNFADDLALLDRAEKGMALIRETRISKYNTSLRESAPKYLKDKGQKKILVVGQVEDDAAVISGSPVRYSNNDIVRIAAAEHPGDTIIYRPHPDVLNNMRPSLSDPQEVADISILMNENVSISAVLDHVDEVYTISSLVGFEALMRQIPVTVFGQPFYSGWGLTRDRHKNSRRNRKLQLSWLFAGAYLLYPTYFSAGATRCDFETAIASLQDRLQGGSGRKPLFWYQELLCKALTPLVSRLGTKDDIRKFRQDPRTFLLSLPKFSQRLVGYVFFWITPNR